MSKKLGLALGAGGSRGVAHIGVLKALEEEGIAPSYISGCSMGAVVGACYANGMTCEKMLSVVSKLKAVNLIDLSAIPVSRLGLLKGNKMHNLLLSNIGDVTFDELKIPFSCVATDLYSGRLAVLSEGKVAPAVRASSSIPAIFRPVRLDDKLLIDGGVLCRVPTEQVRDMGADVVLAVDVLGNTKESVSEVKNMLSMVFRVYDIMDYNAFSMKKKLTERGSDVWIEPEIVGLSQYAVKDMEKAYEAGYAAAKAAMQELKAKLA